ncbi:MAG: hypothetical protein JWQ07_4756 [Ramlibacter sp.]|nr:hypothetical protein [Ramlibacter sp.]
MPASVIPIAAITAWKSRDRSTTEKRARQMVVRGFQDAVANGPAGWHINCDDETEIHLDTGEVFLLRDTGLTRLS